MRVYVAHLWLDNAQKLGNVWRHDTSDGNPHKKEIKQQTYGAGAATA